MFNVDSQHGWTPDLGEGAVGAQPFQWCGVAMVRGARRACHAHITQLKRV